MKWLAFSAFSLFCCCSFLTSAIAQTVPGVRVRALLIDGSQILGNTPIESIKIKLEFSELTIPLSKLRRIDLKAKPPGARLELLNSDVISGQLASDATPVDALFGRVVLKWEHLKSLEVLPPLTAGSMPVRNGLVAYYSFDHGQESLGVDEASEKFQAEVKGARWIAEGKLGGAVEFDGQSTLTLGHVDLLNFTKGLTLSAWINPHEGDRYGYAMIIGKTNGSSWNGGYGLARMSGDQENVYFFVNNYSSSAVKAPVKSGEWSHVVGTFDGKVLKIYVNGKEIESLPASHYAKAPKHASIPELGITPVSAPLIFGSDTSGYFWKGKLDETALFDRPLSEMEIQAIFQAGGMHASATKFAEVP